MGRSAGIISGGYRAFKAIIRKTSTARTIRPLPIPDGFALVIDTREQAPLFERPAPELKIVRKALKHGDYSVRGYESRVCIERKQLSDFYGYIGRERDKTRVKVNALSGMFWAALIIEANERDLLRQYKYGKMTPEQARGFLLSLRVRHGIHTYINKDRNMLERYVLENLVKSYLLLEAAHDKGNSADSKHSSEG